MSPWHKLSWARARGAPCRAPTGAQGMGGDLREPSQMAVDTENRPHAVRKTVYVYNTDRVENINSQEVENGKDFAGDQRFDQRKRHQHR